MHEDPRVILIGTRLAPPVELMRWLFESRGIPYEEQVHAPAFHALQSWRRRVPIELPLVVRPEGAVGGLAASVTAFDGLCRNGETVFGETQEERSRTQELFKLFEAKLFRQAVPLYYFYMLEAPEQITPGAVDGAPAWEKACVRFLFPLWRRVMRRGLKLDEFDPAAACAAIDEAFTEVEHQLAQHGSFLAGAAPGGIDIVFAVLASPVILPDRHAAKTPNLDALPAELKDIVRKYRARDAGKLALRIYEGRTPSQRPARRPRSRLNPLGLLTSAPALRLAARAIARIGPRSIKVGNALAVFRWADVADVLSRDGDFRIAPINERRITDVSGPFILGMDRSPQLFKQREDIYAALHDSGMAALNDVLSTEPARLLDAAAASPSRRLDVVNGYARPVAARAAAAVFGISGPTEQDLMRVSRAVFHETFLNLGGDAAVRESGIAAGQELKGWIAIERDRRHSAGQLGTDVLGQLLRAEKQNELSADEVTHIVSGLLVGAIDTTATAVANIIYEVLNSRSLRRAVLADVDSARLSAWCWEALRRRPHNPILLREAVDGSVAAGRSLVAGTRVVAVTLSAMQDGRIFDLPARMSPNRPPKDYMHFGYGLHACAGRNINAVQIPRLVAEVMRRKPIGTSRLRMRGPFPDELVVKFGDVK